MSEQAPIEYQAQEVDFTAMHEANNEAREAIIAEQKRKEAEKHQIIADHAKELEDGWVGTLPKGTGSMRSMRQLKRRETATRSLEEYMNQRPANEAESFRSRVNEEVFTLEEARLEAEKQKPSTRFELMLAHAEAVKAAQNGDLNPTQALQDRLLELVASNPDQIKTTAEFRRLFELADARISNDGDIDKTIALFKEKADKFKQVEAARQEVKEAQSSSFHVAPEASSQNEEPEQPTTPPRPPRRALRVEETSQPNRVIVNFEDAPEEAEGLAPVAEQEPESEFDEEAGEPALPPEAEPEPEQPASSPLGEMFEDQNEQAEEAGDEAINEPQTKLSRRARLAKRLKSQRQKLSASTAQSSKIDELMAQVDFGDRFADADPIREPVHHGEPVGLSAETRQRMMTPPAKQEEAPTEPSDKPHSFLALFSSRFTPENTKKRIEISKRKHAARQFQKRNKYQIGGSVDRVLGTDKPRTS